VRCHQLFPRQEAEILLHQAKALAALGRIKELRSVLDAIEVAPDIPRVRNTMVRIVEVLRSNGHEQAAREVLERSIRWFENRPPGEQEGDNHRVWYAGVLFLAGQLNEAQRVCDGLVADFPDNFIYRGLRGVVSASLGDTAQAITDSEWLAALDRRSLLGEQTYYRGAIAGALGHREDALSLLRQSFSEGEWHWWPVRSRVETQSLRDYGPFQELMRPKG
jgi:tetratricopeptide (TPR) repeat protein